MWNEATSTCFIYLRYNYNACYLFFNTYLVFNCVYSYLSEVVKMSLNPRDEI